MVCEGILDDKCRKEEVSTSTTDAGAGEAPPFLPNGRTSQAPAEVGSVARG